mgnify:FL=1
MKQDLHIVEKKKINFRKNDYLEFEVKITHLIIDKEPIDIITKKFY